MVKAKALLKRAIPREVREAIKRLVPHKWKVRRIYRDRIREISKSNAAIAPALTQPGDSWANAYAIANGQKGNDYINEVDFYGLIEPRLNPRRSVRTVSDKNVYDRLSLGNLPTTVGRIIQGSSFRPDYSQGDFRASSSEGEVIVKPALDSGGGVGVEFVQLSDLAAWVSAHRSRDDNWIVQEPIQQHVGMAAPNDTAVNTLRILTLCTGDDVQALSVVMRISRRGARVDNQRAGGIAVGVDGEGTLRHCAYDKFFRSYEVHPDTGFRFSGHRLPSFDAAVTAAIEKHRRLKNIGLISWDFAIRADGAPVVIELNVAWQELNFHQLCNGPVLDRLTARSTCSI